MSFRIRPLATAVAVMLGAGTAHAELTSNATEFTTGDTITLKYRANATRGDDLFVAAVVDGSSILFIDEQGGIRPYVAGQATPPRLRAPAAGAETTVFSFQVTAMPEATVDFYSASGRSGGDVLANGLASLDTATLERRSIRIRPKNTTASGKVVDDLASGALVCVDRNANKRCDADEAQAAAAGDGRFSIATTDADLARYTLIAVTSGGYVLESPVGHHAVISPLSTLVQNELDVDRGTTIDKGARMVGIEIGVDSSLLLADYAAAQAGGNPAAATAQQVAQLLAQIWKKLAADTGLAVESDPRRRNAITQYSRNLTYKKGWVFHETLAQAGGNAAAALERMNAVDASLLGDTLRHGKITMLAQQRYRPEWVTRKVSETYVNNPYFYLSYDATTNRITVNGNLQANGKVMKMDLALHPTSSLAAMPSLSALTFTKQGGTYEIGTDGNVTVRGKNGGQSVEYLSTVDELDLGGKTIKLAELLGFSTAVNAIPEAFNLPVTFQAGDKMWREHHDKQSAPLSSMTFTDRASAASLNAYLLEKKDEFAPYATFGNYAVYFKPASAAAPAEGGEMWAYNTSTQTRFQVGRYYPKVDNGRSYLIIEATTLKGVTGATPSSVIYFESTTGKIRYVSWREYVMYCLCWMRKLNLTALQRVIDALEAANSILITPATTVSTAPTGHAPEKARSVIPIATPGTDELNLLKQAVCGGCVGGDCGACPIGDVVGLR